MKKITWTAISGTRNVLERLIILCDMRSAPMLAMHNPYPDSVEIRKVHQLMSSRGNYRFRT
jgi:hypothetical protein